MMYRIFCKRIDRRPNAKPYTAFKLYILTKMHVSLVHNFGSTIGHQ